MFSEAGNRAVQKGIDSALRMTTMEDGPEGLRRNLRTELRRTCKNHLEYGDTAVRECIADEVERRTGVNPGIWDIT